MPGRGQKKLEQQPNSPSSVANKQDAASQPTSKAMLDELGALLQNELRSFKTEIGDILDQRLQQFSSSIRSELTVLKEDTNNAIAAVKEVVSEQATTLAELERGASFTSDEVAKLQEEVRLLTNTVSQLREKCTDLESRSRRQNIRILNIKEGEEKGKNAREFIAELLQTALSLDNPPLIDRAHRSLRSTVQNPRNTQANQYPRAFIVKLHYFHDCESITRKAAQARDVYYKEEKILIFPDLPPAIVKQRARFSRAKDLLRDRQDVRYGFQFPATLRITYQNKEQRFTDPEEAAVYAERLFDTGGNAGDVASADSAHD